MVQTGKELLRRQKLHYFRDGDISPRALAHAAGDLFYFTGYQAEYFLLNLGRGIRALCQGAVDSVLWLWALAGSILRPLWNNIHEDLTAPLRQLRQGVVNLRTMLREEREAGRDVKGKGLRYVLNGIRTYRGLATRALAYLMPLGAAAVFALTVHTVLGYNFALKVEYGGQTLGFIQSQEVYEGARDIVRQRLRGSDADDGWDETPTMTLSVVDKAGLYDQSALANKIVSLSSEKFQDATGVLVNGVLVGVTADSQLVQQKINEALAPQKEALAGQDATVGFRQSVQLDPGLYFTSTLIPGEELVARLTGEAPITLPSGEEIVWNVLSEVQTTIHVTYVEDYSLPEQTVENPELEWGLERVLQEGSAGQRQVEANVMYVDGVEVQRTVLSSADLIAPVQRVVEYGTKNEYGGVAGAIGDGDFIWPVPGYRDVSRGLIRYGSYISHRGLDITAAYYTPILAADNGVVTFAGTGRGYNWSYGNFVKLDHGNGYTSLYGHMAAVAVTEGQYVGKGQVIGYVGSTGRSSGNHCHFEIEKNHVLQDPADYVTRP